MSAPSDRPHDPQTALWRAIDAAANRAAEGLRVVEDFVRFVLDDAHLTRLVKDLRHELAATCAALPLSARHAARDTQRDVGTQITTPAETRRRDAWDVCTASSERSKQALRSLEEFSKAAAPEVSAKFESLRYQLYTIERAMGVTQDSLARLTEARLCVLVEGGPNEEEFSALVEQLVAAGVPMIQLREKRLDSALFVTRAKKICELVARTGSKTLVIINDRPDIAAAVGADGVHLGQDDMRVKEARAVVGPRKLIGVSTHSIDQARTAVLEGANYLGAGPTFPSTTKSFDNFPGLEYLKQIASDIQLPTFAIGGINAENLGDVLATGATRIAISGAVVGASDPGKAARQLIDWLTRKANEPTAPADG